MTQKRKTIHDVETQYGLLSVPVVNRIAVVAAGTDFEQVLFTAVALSPDAGNGYDQLEFGRTVLYKVKKFLWVPDTTQAGATATKSTYTLTKRDAAGANPVTIAVFDGITGADLTALVAKDFGALTAANVGLKAGESVTLVKTHTSTGTATPAGLLVLDLA